MRIRTGSIAILGFWFTAYQLKEKSKADEATAQLVKLSYAGLCCSLDSFRKNARALAGQLRA
jgi:hypothetical protein